MFNLRGNARTSGARRRKEKDNIFGQGSRTSVALLVLVRDPAHAGTCRIHYKDIGDYLSREEKLRIVRKSGSIADVPDWLRIAPDDHDDWLDQRDPEYQKFLPLGIKSQKFQTSVSAMFSLLSLGIVTARDPWVYSFDREQLNQRIWDMTVFFMNSGGRKYWAEK